jgi:hypothetical protein
MTAAPLWPLGALECMGPQHLMLGDRERLREVTRRLVPYRHLPQLWFLVFTDGELGDGAAGVEPAPGWRINGAGHIAAQDDTGPLPLFLRIRNRHSR